MAPPEKTGSTGGGMKRTHLFPAGLLLGLIVVSGYAPAEGQVVPQIQRKKLPVVVRPDLALEDLTVDPSPGSSDPTYFHFRFQVTVKNVGSAPTDRAFSVAFQYYYQGQSSWQGENDKNNCFPVIPRLQPNGSRVVQGDLRVLKSMLSGQSVRLRALADFACNMEFPPRQGQIMELDENNNASNEITIPASSLYRPHVGGVSPASAERGIDRVTLSGRGFGAQAGDHIVVIKKDNGRVAAVVQSWRDGVITFVVPASLEGGRYTVYIGDKTRLEPVSNMLDLKVLETRAAPWAKVLDVWDIFKDAFSIRLHNWSGGPQEESESEMRLIRIEPLDVYKVELSTAIGSYRFLVNDLRSTTAVLNKTGCNANQLRIDVPFESKDPEMIGYFKALGPAGAWRRTGAPDVEVDNAVASVWLTFTPTGGSLNYFAHSAFEADIHTTNRAWKSIMNAFVGGWEQSVKNQVVRLINDRFNEGQTKAEILQSFILMVRLATKTLASQRDITRFKFTNSGIEVTFY
jgi:hypothetical protein